MERWILSNNYRIAMGVSSPSSLSFDWFNIYSIDLISINIKPDFAAIVPLA